MPIVFDTGGGGLTDFDGNTIIALEQDLLELGLRHCDDGLKEWSGTLIRSCDFDSVIWLA